MPLTQPPLQLFELTTVWSLNFGLNGRLFLQNYGVRSGQKADRVEP
jgi:hypothetical protein